MLRDRFMVPDVSSLRSGRGESDERSPDKDECQGSSVHASGHRGDGPDNEPANCRRCCETGKSEYQSGCKARIRESYEWQGSTMAATSATISDSVRGATSPRRSGNRLTATYTATGRGARSRTIAPVKVEPVVPVSSTVAYVPIIAGSPGMMTVLKSRVRA